MKAGTTLGLLALWACAAPRPAPPDSGTARDAGGADAGSVPDAGALDAGSGADAGGPADAGCAQTCAELGVWCGTASDGCGHTLDCGGPCQAVAGCREITDSGSYQVTTNLSASGVCLYVHDTGGVTVFCDGGSLTGFPALSVQNVQSFRLAGCSLAAQAGTVFGATLLGIDGGWLTGNTFHDVVDLESSRAVTVSANLFTNAGGYQQSHCVGSRILQNDFVYQGVLDDGGWRVGGGALITSFGTGNTLLGNHIDGGWTGGTTAGAFDHVGMDDGIILQDESNDLVQGNGVYNVWDCGLETLGTNDSLTVSGNFFDLAAFCTIGGWYWNSVSNSLFAFNTGNRSGPLFVFSRICGLRSQDTGVYFTQNRFVGNVWANADLHQSRSAELQLFNDLAYNGGTCMPGPETVPTSAQFVLSGNVFSGNDFGHLRPGPVLGIATSVTIPGVVVDDGGNTCLPPSYEPGYPINCQ